MVALVPDASLGDVCPLRIQKLTRHDVIQVMFGVISGRAHTTRCRRPRDGYATHKICMLGEIPVKIDVPVVATQMVGVRADMLVGPSDMLQGKLGTALENGAAGKRVKCLVNLANQQAGSRAPVLPVPVQPAPLQPIETPGRATKRARAASSGVGGAPAVATGASGGASAVAVGATAAGQPPGAKKQVNPRPAVPRCCDSKYRLPMYLQGAPGAIAALGAASTTGAGQVNTNAGHGWSALSSIPVGLRAVLDQYKSPDAPVMHGSWCTTDCPPKCTAASCLGSAGQIRQPPVGKWSTCSCAPTVGVPVPVVVPLPGGPPPPPG